jgi:hypothetical protein
MAAADFTAWAVVNGRQTDGAIEDPWRMRTRRIRDAGRTVKKSRAAGNCEGIAGGHGLGETRVRSTVGQGSRRMARSAERVYFDAVLGSADRRAAKLLAEHGWRF